ncbi:hypothetical protein [Streptococcus pluranimalium]|nr:hypothetical protein [Streptococcus suis]
MNNLTIIAVGTFLSVTLIESLLLNVRLKKALKKAKEESSKSKMPTATVEQKGFIDFNTGRRVDLGPRTRSEVPVNKRMSV